jgi:transcriptional regulator with XRE-family HTH domain
METNVLYQLGERVRSLRKEKDLTQEELAVRSKISLKYIQRIESKTPSDIGLECLEKLSKGFDISLWQLLRFKE